MNVIGVQKNTLESLAQRCEKETRREFMRALEAGYFNQQSIDRLSDKNHNYNLRSITDCRNIKISKSQTERNKQSFIPRAAYLIQKK